jgi:hypothetical protein
MSDEITSMTVICEYTPRSVDICNFGFAILLRVMQYCSFFVMRASYDISNKDLSGTGRFACPFE